MNKITKLDQKASLKQANSLVEAKYRLTTYEQRMVIAICSQLKNESELPKIHVKTSDLADFCKFPPSKKLDMVRTTARKLRGRTLEFIKPNGKWYITGWLNSADLLDDGTIEFVIDEKLKPQLLQLKAAYLSTPAAPLMEFKCDYTARLYFLLKKMLKVYTFEYKLDFIRERFMLSKSYDIFFNLKNKVLEPALKEINEKSDITVEHEYIKQGRVYAKIKFIVKKKDKEDKKKALPAPAPSEQAPEPIEKELEDLGQTKLFTPPQTPPEQDAEKKSRELFFKHEILFSKMSRYFLNKQIEELIIKYGAERVEANLKFAEAENKKSKKRSMTGWIISCIEQDHAAAAEVIAENAKQSSMRSRIERDQKLREKLDREFGLDDAEASMLIKKWGIDRVTRNADYILSNCNYKQKEERKAHLATAIQSDAGSGSNGAKKPKRKRGDYSPYHYSAKEYQHIYV